MKNLFLILSVFCILTSCAPAPVYKAAGTLDNEKYVFEYVTLTDTFMGGFQFNINGTPVLTHTWKNLHNQSQCSKLAVASWRCAFSTTYKGKPVELIHQSEASLVYNRSYMDVYINDEFVQRIVTTVNT